MKSVFRSVLLLLALLLLLFVSPKTGYAYGGPGSVISGLGALLAAIAALLASIFGFLWFPLKRLFQKMRGDEQKRTDTKPEQVDG